MSDNSLSSPTTAPADPGPPAVLRFLLYTVSMPERALRSGVGLVGGALKESTALLVPQAFQDSKTYEVLMRQTLDFLVTQVGGVQAATPAKEAEHQVENFVARKAVGNFLDLAGLATLHMSPILLLAVVSDVAYGSKTYLRELADELRAQGVIEQNSTVDQVDDLFDAISRASSTMATAVNTPPLSLEGLRKTIDETRTALAEVDPTAVIPQAEIDRLWGEMRSLAKKEGVGIFEISSTVTLSVLDKIGNLGRGALSTVTVVGILLDRHVITHYAVALSMIRDRGLYTILSEASRPYIEAVWYNFATDRPTLTEDLLSGRMAARAWQTIKHWYGRGEGAESRG